MAETRRILARGLGPEPEAAFFGGACRKTFGRFDMRGYQTGERHGPGLQQLGEPADARLQPIDKPAHLPIPIAEGCSEAGDARGRTRPKDRLPEPPRQPTENSGIQPAGGKGMLECSE